MADKKVLVADDEPHVLHAVSLKLRDAGYQVLTACNGREALERAQQEHPDLVIADYAMPCLSGLELCRKLKTDPATRDIPAIMLTAIGYDVKLHAAGQSGINRQLNKPFSRRNLLASVSQVLEHTLPS